VKKLLMLLLLPQLLQAETIILTRKNTVNFRGPMMQGFTQSLIDDLAAKREALPADKTIYIVQESPGGYVHEAVMAAKAVAGFRNVKIIAVASASASAFFLQMQPHERLITYDGHLMFHQIMIVICDMVNATQLAYMYNRIVKESKPLYLLQARRMKKPLAWFMKKLQHTWVPGAAESVKEGAVDRAVDVGCDQDLSSHSEKIRVCEDPDNCYVQTWSDCPLLGQPLSVEKE